MELIGVIVLVVIVIGAAIGSIVALTGGSSSSEPSLQAAAPPPAPTPTPTQGPESSPAERLDALRVELGKIEALNVEEYPADLEFYSNLAPDASNVGHLAVQWVVSEDPAEVRVYSQTNIEHLVSRFGLASLYLALGGPNWVSSDKWMTDAPVCEWEGVECNKNSQQIEELDLSNNNLKGMLPMEMVVLQSIKKLFLRQNSIEGPLGGFLGQLPNLTALFLNDNLLEGDIPDELAAGGNLSKFFMRMDAPNSLRKKKLYKRTRLSHFLLLYMDLHRRPLFATKPIEGILAVCLLPRFLR